MQVEDEEKDDEEEKRSKWNADVYNGTLGYVVHVDIDEKILFVQFEGINGVVKYNQDRLDKIELAYAISIHRSQGSASKHVVLALDFSSYMLLSRQLVYTGLTRASEKGVLLAESKALHKAISTNASSRRTFLQDIIRGGRI